MILHTACNVDEQIHLPCGSASHHSNSGAGLYRNSGRTVVIQPRHLSEANVSVWTSGDSRINAFNGQTLKTFEPTLLFGTFNTCT